MDHIRDAAVLVTGGAGSAGQAFTRRALGMGARKVVVYSRDEGKHAQMAQAFHDERLRFLLGDVRDRDRLEWAMRGIDTVVHAAALKRVDNCEADPAEAAATNIAGSLNVAHAAIKAGVRRALLLSTDKAANPVTLYGATKLCAERLWIGANVYAAGTPTRLSATRYGNVLASRGSVLPLWRGQYERGEPLTITDVRASRFWMRMDDAVDLICTALRRMRGGEIFIPRIGSAPILDLARAVVEVNGTYAPGHVETGLRMGEKMHETLITVEEAARTYDFGTFYVVEPAARSWETLPPPDAPRVASGFSYDSLTNPKQLSVHQLREMAA